MSDLILPSRGLIVGSFLFNSEYLSFSELKQIWCERFASSLEFHHPYFPMAVFYSKEMGKAEHLERVLLASLSPVSREELVSHKMWADNWEKELFRQHHLRTLNLDIGLLTLENLILATGKNFSHRVYLGSGVFADLNLFYEDKTYKSFSWTYPDYGHADFIAFFNFVRGFLARKNNIKNT